MNRKQFVWLGASGMALLALPASWYYFRDVPYDPQLAEPATLSQIWDRPTLLEMGKQYIIQSGETSERTLVKKLLAKSKDDKQALANIPQRISEDFANGDIVQLDGWILSRTEARQCALYSIIQSEKK